jgi:hypothetical protein
MSPHKLQAMHPGQPSRLPGSSTSRTQRSLIRDGDVTQKRLADYIGLTVRRLRSDRGFTLQALPM